MTTLIEARVPIAFRCKPDERDQIDARAKERRMTRTDYLVQAALGQLDGRDLEAERWREHIDQRLNRLEQLAFDG